MGYKTRPILGTVPSCPSIFGYWSLRMWFPLQWGHEQQQDTIAESAGKQKCRGGFVLITLIVRSGVCPFCSLLGCCTGSTRTPCVDTCCSPHAAPTVAPAAPTARHDACAWRAINCRTKPAPCTRPPVQQRTDTQPLSQSKLTKIPRCALVDTTLPENGPPASVSTSNCYSSAYLILCSPRH